MNNEERQNKCGEEDSNTCTMCRMHNSMCGKNACGMCGGMNHHFLLRIIIGIAIVTFIFWLGVHVGMFVSEGSRYSGYDGYGAYGGRMMDNRYNDYGVRGGQSRGMGPSMMYYNYDESYVTPQQVQVSGKAALPASTQTAPTPGGITR